MSRLFPRRTEPDLADRDPRLVDLADESADQVFEALSSTTARRILLALHEEPRPASAVADAVDTSVQNVQYHLENLRAADLVEVVDTWYSESGTEMTVYAPSDEALVLFAGEEPERSLRSLLERLGGALGAVGIGAVVAWSALGELGEPSEPAAPTDPNATVVPGSEAGAGIDPVLVAGAVVAGGLLALAGYVAVRFAQRRWNPTG